MAFLSKNIHYPPVCVSEEGERKSICAIRGGKGRRNRSNQGVAKSSSLFGTGSSEGGGMMPDWKPGYKNGKPGQGVVFFGR